MLTHLVEWPRFKALTSLNDGKGVNYQEFSFLIGGDLKWYHHFKRQLGSFLQN
jgi:hypothetical protein